MKEFLKKYWGVLFLILFLTIINVWQTNNTNKYRKLYMDELTDHTETIRMYNIAIEELIRFQKLSHIAISKRYLDNYKKWRKFIKHKED